MQPAQQYRKPPASASIVPACWNCGSLNVRRATPPEAPEQRCHCNHCGANGEESDFRGVAASAAIVNRRRPA